MSAETRQQTTVMVASILIIELISGFTQGYYEPLIPKFGEVLGIDASGLQLFNVIPTAIAALVVPVLTRLGDIKGYRKLLRFVIPSVFIATLLILAGVLVGSWELVLVGRVFNGPIAVWMPLMIALVYAKATGGSAPKAASAIVAVMTVGTVVGTAASGFIYNGFGDLVASCAIVPVMHVVCVLLVFFVMPEYVSGASSYIDGKGFVGLGIVMLLAIFGFVEVVEGGVDTIIGAVLIIAALVVGVFWYRYQKRIENPAIDVRIMFSRNLFPLYVAAMCYGAVFYGFLAPLATFLAADPSAVGYGYGLDPSGISLSQTGILVFTVLAALVLPVALNKFHAKPALLLGLALALAGFLLWSVPGNGLPKLVGFVFLVGMGIGLVAAAIPVIIPQRSTVETRGIATGLFNSAQTLGGALGGGLFLSLLKVGATAEGAITATGYTTVWVTCAGIFVIGLVIVAVFLTKNVTDATLQ